MKELNRKTYPANTMIFHEGEIAYAAFLLKSGRVEISTLKDGRRVVLTTIMPNQLFGGLALIDGAPRSATATAIETWCAVAHSSQKSRKNHKTSLSLRPRPRKPGDPANSGFRR